MARNDDKPHKDEFAYQRFREPTMTPERRSDIDRAAAAHVECNRSDPFARNRIVHYMRRGLELPSDVLAEANSQLATRSAKMD